MTFAFVTRFFRNQPHSFFTECENRQRFNVTPVTKENSVPFRGPPRNFTSMFSPYFPRCYRRTTWAGQLARTIEMLAAAVGEFAANENPTYVHDCLECTIQINWAVIAVALTIRYIDSTSTGETSNSQNFVHLTCQRRSWTTSLHHAIAPYIIPFTVAPVHFSLRSSFTFVIYFTVRVITCHR